MKARKLFVSIGIIFSTVVATSSAAHAAAFTSNVSQNTDGKANIFLNSITQNGKTFSNFSYVNRAKIVYNTPKNPLNLSTSGAASTDKGDKATAPLAPNEDPTAAEIAAYLGNNNLNNIIDGEDKGAFTLDIFFDSEIATDNSGLDHLFYWERGMNSYIDIQALDAVGNLIGNKLNINQTTNPLNYAGFKINTTEIGAAQLVGSWGINLNELGVNKLSGLRLSAQSKHNGPDFKFVARKILTPSFGPVVTVSEPGTIFSLGAIATLALLYRRQSQSNLSP